MTVGGLAGLVDAAVLIGLGGHGLALALARGLHVQGRQFGGQIVRHGLGPLLGERLVVGVVGHGVGVPHHSDRCRRLAVPAGDDLVEYLLGAVGQGGRVDVKGDVTG